MAPINQQYGQHFHQNQNQQQQQLPGIASPPDGIPMATAVLSDPSAQYQGQMQSQPMAQARKISFSYLDCLVLQLVMLVCYIV